MMDIQGFLHNLTIWLLPTVLAITLHEAAHGFAAWKLGDDTALRLGRVTVNPLRHVDPFGTVLFPLLLALGGSPVVFGWAKPVPVNFGRLGNVRRDMALVALAGPGTNLVLAILSLLLLHLSGVLPNFFAEWFQANLRVSVIINIVLMVFNMLPLPPLDGSKVLASLLPGHMAYRFLTLERYGFLILIGLLLLLPMLGNALGYDVNFMRYLVGVPADWVLTALAQLTGHGT